MRWLHKIGSSSQLGDPGSGLPAAVSGGADGGPEGMTQLLILMLAAESSDAHHPAS